MNIFDRLIARETEQDTRLGCPAGSPEAIERRMNALARMTGGNGFRTPKRGPKISKGGTTRKERNAHVRPNYLARLRAEADFTAALKGKPGWSIARIRDAIARGDHLKTIDLTRSGK